MAEIAQNHGEYVVLFPHSISNPSADYRVVTLAGWSRASNEGQPVDAAVERFATFDEANARAAQLNERHPIAPWVVQVYQHHAWHTLGRFSLVSEAADFYTWATDPDLWPHTFAVPEHRIEWEYPS